MSATESRLQKWERILEISRELTSTVALEPLLHTIVEAAAELTDSEAASILLLDAQTGELHFRAASADSSDQLRDIPVPVGSSIAGDVLVSGKPAVISDVRTTPRHYPVVGQRIGLDICSLLAVPLSIKERRIGVLEAINKCSEGTFSQEDLEVLTTLAAQAAVAIENARLVSALQDAYERLGELDRLKSDFIAIASHELRTPLNLILLYAAMLQEQMGDRADPQLDAVLRAVTRLKHIIETMLNLRYLETGEIQVTRCRFDIRDEVREVCQDYEAIAGTEGLTLRVNLPDEEVPVLADREKVRVILENLISNAVRFTPSGGWVHVSLSRRGDEIEVAVADSGVGIEPQHLERIFERFYQIEDHMTRHHGGMGLGLSIVRGLAELHGGRVSVESVPGRGSRFAVTLPASPAQATAALSEAVGQPGS
jgi:signal transduction histidine kinase